MNGRTKEEVLSLAAALEQHSRHPVAEAIVSEAGSLSLADVTDFESVTGQGVQGTISGVRHRVGRSDLFNGESASLTEISKGSVIVGTDEEVLGQIVVEDEVREEASRTIVALKAAGVHVVMLTGDDEVTAARVAEVVGIEAFHARLMPEDKVRLVRELEDVHGSLAMVGDGVNDAPALAAATVGVAMGVAGSDTALETADVALMGDDLTKLPYLLRLSRASTRVIHQNVITSILIKVALAIGVIPGLVSLVTAVMVGDMGTSLGVTGNALRLAKRRP
jgi:Cd2+/Zn2+-exporting ATPase